jgi:octaprenyl-diphosphate synthase
MQPQTFYRAVADDFSAVDEIIKKQLTSRVPLVSKIGDYITSAGGKRLRPLLVLLCGKALGREGDDLRLLAATIEFLHTATLLHDDVVDMSGMRRGRSTANALWGNAPSVLVGDFLYSRSFEMMVELGSMPVMQILSKATRVIAEGEVLQLSRVRDASTTEEVYMEVIRGKTAMLFEASTHSAAALAQATDEQREALRTFGDHLGVAFQLVDDLLDYKGDSQTLGKNVGDDLAEGKPTLPLIYTMREGTPSRPRWCARRSRKVASKTWSRSAWRSKSPAPWTTPQSWRATTWRVPLPAWKCCRQRIPGCAGRAERVCGRAYALTDRVPIAGKPAPTRPVERACPRCFCPDITLKYPLQCGLLTARLFV